MKRILFFLTMVLSVAACDPVNEEPQLYPDGKGMFILNEGNFMAGNGSVSFYSFETGMIYNNLFSTRNGRALGDIPMFMTARNDKGYIVVNNSGTIEIVDIKTMESLGTVTGLVSPRQIVISDNKGYVSSLLSDEISVINLSDFTVDHTIDIGATTEAMILSGNSLFAASWSGGNRISVIDTGTDELSGTITTGLEPESMAIDKNGYLWVLCTGGYLNEEIPRLMKISTTTLTTENEFSFRTVSDNPSSLTINNTGDTLYYLDEGIRVMPVNATALPTEALTVAGGGLLYKLAAAPWQGMICVTDAIDYQQKGDLLICNRSGEIIDTEQAGIIPGFMYFVTD